MYGQREGKPCVQANNKHVDITLPTLRYDEVRGFNKATKQDIESLGWKLLLVIGLETMDLNRMRLGGAGQWDGSG